MIDILRIAARNLLRYKRRTLLTSLLITVGLVAVLLFIAIAGSFKSMMVGQFTDSMVGHIQVHKRGYVGAMESLPVDRNMRTRMLVKLYEALDSNAPFPSSPKMPRPQQRMGPVCLHAQVWKRLDVVRRTGAGQGPSSSP